MYARRTAFIRDWYRGPCFLNQSRTSSSIRSEIGAGLDPIRVDDGERDA
jgi:hypothetical protein